MEKKTKRGRQGCLLYGITAFIVVQCVTLVFVILWQEWHLEILRSRVSEKRYLLEFMEPLCNSSHEQFSQDLGQTRYRRQDLTDWMKDFFAIQAKALETICSRRYDLCIPGPKGMTGDQGSNGPLGDTGLTGTLGQKGNQGPVGLTGDKGGSGPKGITGATGATSLMGPRGDKGDAGLVGDVGLKGDIGEIGMSGTDGLVGETGTSGSKGRAGPKGTRGMTGLKGEAGLPGIQGETGVQGVRGLDGRELHAECLCLDDFNISSNFGRFVSIAYGAPLSLHCQFNIKNIPVTWSKDGGPLSKRVTTSGNDLVFEQVLTPDAGTYRCSGPDGILGYLSKSVPVIVGSSSIYDCDFESQCSWTDVTGDNMDWTAHAGRTPSANTGPDNDHTFGNASGHYIYLETSSGTPGYNAVLQSKPLSAHHQFCLTFWFQMYGGSVGRLEVRLKVAGQVRSPLWSATGNQGNFWLMAKVDLAPQTTNYYVELNAVRGSTYTGDIGVDDIIFLDGHCP